jgi:hypothetical protein
MVGSTSSAVGHHADHGAPGVAVSEIFPRPKNSQESFSIKKTLI